MKSMAMLRRLVVGGALLLAAAVSSAKTPVQTLDDMPRHTYRVAGSVSAMLADPAAFGAFCASVRTDIESDLATYEIGDKAARQRLLNTLLSLDLQQGRDADVAARVEAVRALEDKEATRLTTGLVALAWIDARRAAGNDASTPAFKAAFRAALDRELAALPADLVRDNIQSQKGRMEIMSPTVIAGMVQSQLDPIVAAAGEVSSDLAGQIVGLGVAMTTVLPLREELVAAYAGFLDAGKEEKKDIWAARDVSLEGHTDLKPVTVAIWDSGVDVDAFPNGLFTNAAEKPDGKDDDGNGFIDDIHGIAWDYDGKAVPELLHPLGDQTGRLEAAMQSMKGFTDLGAGVDSPEASALRKHMSGMGSADVGPFMESLGFAGLHAHGTHVTGIALAGNPAARALVARISFDYHTIPKPLTAQTAQAHAESYSRTVDYFRAHGVRAVNMSWGWSLKEIESSLEANNVGGTAAERGRLAAEMLGTLRNGMEKAMKSAPDILFVAAAGNDDNDVEFDQSMPGSLDLPNLMMVGAVDQAGRRTGFTSSGRRVRVYANGFEVDSNVPGGGRMKMSGTSMASPNALNLAAKLFAVKPALTPQQVVSLIERGADTVDGQEGLKLINPRRSLELLAAE
ncbi:MAG: S8 family serine peptidase [bacterium]|nr:S8 family serine peptidase [bacterium]